MNDFVLAIIGSIGIGALALSMKNDEIREDFMFPMKNSKLNKVVKGEYGESELKIDQYPNVKCKDSKPNKSSNLKPNKMNSVEGFENRNQTLGNGLGARDITNSPYVTPTPHYNQTVNQPSPSLNLPSLLRYNPPSLSKMGITENFQEKRQTPVREDYNSREMCNKPQHPYMSSNVYEVPAGYTASPLPKPVMNTQFQVPEDNLSKAGNISDPLSGNEVMVFDRPMTTTLKVGRFALKGCRDLIRGDLPVAPNNHQGWFATPADPSALSKGALQAIGGESESTKVMNKFMEIYGDASGVGSGVNLSDPVSNQYTAYEMTMKNKGVCENTVSVQSF